MSESRKHMDLVGLTVSYVKSIVPVDYQAFIQYDSPDTLRPPNVINNFVPDVYYRGKDLLIIGEAKTFDDFERAHSKRQYEAYMEEMKSFQGKRIFVVSVPWQLVPTAKNYFRRLRSTKNVNITIVVINEMGRSFEV